MTGSPYGGLTIGTAHKCAGWGTCFVTSNTTNARHLRPSSPIPPASIKANRTLNASN